MLMNLQAPGVLQDPTTQQQLLTQQMQQQQFAQPQAQTGVQQVANPWAGAAMLANALVDPRVQPSRGSGASTSPLQNLLNWLNSPSTGDEDVAGGSD